MKINIPSNTKTVILNIVSNEMIELKNAVNEAKIKLGLSNSELSKLIGNSRNYISETLRIGASTEKQAQLVKKIKEAAAAELVSRGVCGIGSTIERIQDVNSGFVRKDYHEREITHLKNEIETEKSLRSMSEHLNDTKQAELEEQKQNVRMLNMEVEQLKQANKLVGNDLAIANRDKNFMKKKLQDKNLIINWLVASNVFFILFLVAKCVGWV